VLHPSLRQFPAPSLAGPGYESDRSKYDILKSLVRKLDIDGYHPRVLPCSSHFCSAHDLMLTLVAQFGKLLATHLAWQIPG
jgi:hypothetical protein